MRRAAILTLLYVAVVYIVTEYVDEHVGWLVSLDRVEKFGRRLGW